MSVGDGIFLGSLVLALVGLYATTKDRWNWRLIAKRLIGWPLALIAVFGAGFWAYGAYQARPVMQVAFQGVNIGSAPEDVKFLMGAPIPEHSAADRWVYRAGTSDDAFVVVQFKNGRVRHVSYRSNENRIVTPNLLGLSKGSTLQEVVGKLGQPSSVSTRKDGLRRIAAFEQYRVFYEFERGAVSDYGVYDPDAGAMKYVEEQAATSPTPSASTP